MAHTILLAGCGNMGRAMLQGWLKAMPDLAAYVVEPAEPLRAGAASLGAHVVGAAADLPEGLAPDLVFLAVKPQVMLKVLPDYARFGGAAFVSVAAGTTVETLKGGLGGNAPIIRCMPNTPAAIGAGMMVCFGTPEVSDASRALASTLLAASGEVAWIESEELMDAVTAVSGSGPAYVFHMIEALAAAGVAAGLPEDLSGLLARQTVMGAGRLAMESNTPPGILREQVTSPGGTTAAGLSVLMQDGALQSLMTKAVEAARERGEALGRL